MTATNALRCGVGALSVLVVLACAGVPGASADPTVSIVPTVVFVQPGNTATFEIHVDDSGDPISCFIVQIHFDPSIIGILDITEGELYETGGNPPTFPDWELVAPDTLQASNCILGSGTFILGPGAVADVEILAIGDGVTPIEFTFVQVRDIDRIPYGNPGSIDGLVVTQNVSVSDDTVTDGTDTDGTLPVTPQIALRVAPNPAPGWTRVFLRESASTVGSMQRGSGVPHAIDLQIFDVSGRLVRTIAGRTGSDVRWDGRDAAGALAPSGLYVIRLGSDRAGAAKVLLTR